MVPPNVHDMGQHSGSAHVVHCGGVDDHGRSSVGSEGETARSGVEGSTPHLSWLSAGDVPSRRTGLQEAPASAALRVGPTVAA